MIELINRTAAIYLRDTLYISLRQRARAELPRAHLLLYLRSTLSYRYSPRPLPATGLARYAAGSATSQPHTV